MKKKDFLRYEFLLLFRGKISACGRGVWLCYNENISTEYINGVSDGLHCLAVVGFGKKRVTEVLLKVYKDGTFDVDRIYNGSSKAYEATLDYHPSFTDEELAVIEEYKKKNA